MVLHKPTLNPCLRDFWTTRARNKVLYGGRASSKSWDAAGMAVYLSNNFNIRVLCTRQIQNKIDESVYALLKVQIERFGLQANFRILENKIINKTTGSEFLFYGLWRHTSEIKSLEGVDILWLEEAHALTPKQWEILEPTIRKESSECWFIFNPNLTNDFVYQEFVINPPDNTVVRKINYDENPFLSKTIQDVIQSAKKRDYEAFEHIYLGVPRDDDDEAVIKRSWIEAAIDAHVKLKIDVTGRSRIGFDIADSGADKCATVKTHGILATDVKEWKAKEDELLKSCTKVYMEALSDYSEITYDSIGVGASAGAKFFELNENKKENISYKAFNAGGAVFEPDNYYDKHQKIKNKDYFLNIKSQAWWLIADRFRNTYNAVHNGVSFKEDELISISSAINPSLLEKLKTELSTPKRDFDTSGKVKVESKKDLAKRDIKSPNLADAFVMAYAPVKQQMIIADEAFL